MVLAAAHLDHDPTNNRRRNLRSLCQRCHLLQDRAYHRLQRWITYRLRDAAGDLFLGRYRHVREAALALAEILARIACTSAGPGPGIAGRGGVRQTPRLKNRPAPPLSWPDAARDWLRTTDQEHSWHVPLPAAGP